MDQNTRIINSGIRNDFTVYRTNSKYRNSVFSKGSDDDLADDRSQELENRLITESVPDSFLGERDVQEKLQQVKLRNK